MIKLIHLVRIFLIFINQFLNDYFIASEPVGETTGSEAQLNEQGIIELQNCFKINKYEKYR